jgi:hypothetical protein
VIVNGVFMPLAFLGFIESEKRPKFKGFNYNKSIADHFFTDLINTIIPLAIISGIFLFFIGLSLGMLKSEISLASQLLYESITLGGVLPVILLIILYHYL